LRNPAPVENGGLSQNILLGIQPSQIGGAGFRNHPHYHSSTQVIMGLTW
jgi:hypothetical protein